MAQIFCGARFLACPHGGREAPRCVYLRSFGKMYFAQQFAKTRIISKWIVNGRLGFRVLPSTRFHFCQNFLRVTLTSSILSNVVLVLEAFA